MKREDKKLPDTSIMSRGAFLLVSRTKIKVHFVIVPSRGEGGVFMFRNAERVSHFPRGELEFRTTYVRKQQEKKTTSGMRKESPPPFMCVPWQVPREGSRVLTLKGNSNCTQENFPQLLSSGGQDRYVWRLEAYLAFF